MSKPITNDRTEIWNTRFSKCLTNKFKTQREFAEAYSQKYGYAAQSDVCRWMKIGERNSKNLKPRKFPAFETMCNIADLLEVSVGYLIGETDFDSFEEERTSKYIGLSSQSIKIIQGLTTGKTIPPFYKYSDPQRLSALEQFLSNSWFLDYLKGICDINAAVSNLKNPTDYFKEALNTIPEIYRNKALALWKDSKTAIEEYGIKPTKKLWNYVNILDSACEVNIKHTEELDRELKAARYSLSEIHTRMLDEITSKDHNNKTSTDDYRIINHTRVLSDDDSHTHYFIDEE